MAPMTARLRRTLERFIRAREGAAAAEMALIALPFFMMMFGIIELALVFLLNSTLENATAITARAVRTGEMQTAGGASAAAFKTSICNNLGWLAGDCASNLYIDIRTFSTFAAVNMPDPAAGGVMNQGNLAFSLGGPGDIVVVRAYYRWPFITPLIGQAMKQMSDGSMLVVSTATFRNEPYGS